MGALTLKMCPAELHPNPEDNSLGFQTGVFIFEIKELNNYTFTFNIVHNPMNYEYKEGHYF